MDVTRRNVLRSAAALAAAQTVHAANDRLQIGFVGCGARAQELLGGVLKTPGTEVVALVDAYKGRIERTQSRVSGKAKVYPTYKELLADKSVDAVVIATPDHWHRQMIVDAVRAGKDVYCEKPMTYTASEGAPIIAAVKESGRIVQIGSQGVSTDTDQKARVVVQSGKLGKVTMVRASYNRNTASGAWIYPIPPDASPATVDWDMFQGPAPKKPFSLERFFRWRCYHDYSGGIATDLFVHLCTSIHYIMGAKVPSRVIALGELYRWKESRDVPDTLNAVLEYPEGFVVTLSSTFNGQSGPEAGFQFIGTEGMLAIGRDVMFYPDKSREDNRWIVDSWPKALEDAYYADPKVRAEEVAENPKKNLQPEKITVREDDSTAAHIGNWVTGIRNRKPVYEDAVVGHHAASCAHMVNMAAREHLAVQWDVERDDIQSS